MRKRNWAPIFVLNLFIVLWFWLMALGLALHMYAYSTIQSVDDVKTFHVFAEWHQSLSVQQRVLRLLGSG